MFFCTCDTIFAKSQSICPKCNIKAHNSLIIPNFETKIIHLCLKTYVVSTNIFRLKVCIYSDGISKFKSSKKSIWPIYLVSVDLDFKNRFKLHNIILLGIYYGDKKPNLQLCLSKIFDQYYHSGDLCISKKQNQYFVDICFVVADKPARAMLLNMQSFNSKFFCPICLCCTKTIFDGKKRKIFVPLKNNLFFCKRNKECTNAIVFSAISTRQPDYGFKGSCFLLNLNSFNITDSILIDYMHGICSCVFKNLINLLFFEKFKTIQPPLKKYLGSFDKVSKSFKPSPLLPRGTPLLANFAHWKSKDYKNFIFFALPQIKFDQEYHKCIYDTVMLLRRSIFLLLTNGLDSDRLDKIHGVILEII